MSINTILCHPAADSLVSLTQAANYAAHHPASGLWNSLSEAQQETLLATASRHVAACPLVAPPLLTSVSGSMPQALAIPIVGHPHRFGTADNATTTTLCDAALAGYADDLFVGGSLVILDGTGEGQWASVTGFTAEDGVLTLSPELSIAPDANSRYLLIWPLAKFVVAAVVEQALYLARGVNFNLLNDAGMGVASRNEGGEGGGSFTLNTPTSLSHLCHEARIFLRRSDLLNTDRSVVVGRG